MLAIVTCFLTEKGEEACQAKVVGKLGGKRTLLEGNVRESLGKIEPDLRHFNLRIINGDVCTLGEEIANERDSGRFTGVACVGLECKAEDGNVLPKGQSASKRI